jgi:hypothetical protein
MTSLVSPSSSIRSNRGNDVGVGADARVQQALAFDASADVGIFEQGCRDALDGDATAEHDVVRKKDVAHSSRAQTAFVGEPRLLLAQELSLFQSF